MVDLAGTWESLNDKCWPLLDALHLGEIFEQYKLPPILFPILLIVVILLLIMALSGGGGSKGCNTNGICDSWENHTMCPDECGPPIQPIKGKRVVVKFDKKPSCNIKVVLFDSNNVQLGTRETSEKSEVEFTGIEASTVHVTLEGNPGQTQNPPSSSVDKDPTTIEVPLGASLCERAISQNGVLQLTIKDASTNTQLNGVTVRISEMQNGYAVSTPVQPTTINGYKDFTLQGSKTYTVFVEKTGYNSVQEQVTISSGGSLPKAISLTPLPTPNQKGDLEVCVKNGTQPLLSGVITVSGLSSSVTGEISEATAASEPRGPGCFVFKDLEAGKTVTVSMLSPPAGCVPVSTPSIKITAAGREIVDLTLQCSASNVGYLKLKVVSGNGTVLTQNATITLWTTSGDLIPGSGLAGSLALGTNSYTEEITVPSNSSIYAWVRGLPLGFQDYRSQYMTVASGQHRAIEIRLNYSSDSINYVSRNFSFSGVAYPSVLLRNQTFTVTIDKVMFGQTELTGATATVTASAGGNACLVYYDTKWTATCTAPSTTGQQNLVIQARYGQNTGTYSNRFEVREYGAGSGLLVITPVFATHDDPPLDLFYEITFNGTPVTNLINQKITGTYMDSPNAYVGIISNLMQSGEYWTLNADVPYKGDYQLTMFIEIVSGSVFYNTTYTVGFSATSHSNELQADVVLSKKFLNPLERFTIDVVLKFKNKIASNLEIFKLYMNGVYYTFDWKDAEKRYRLALTSPYAEICNLELRFVIKNLDLPNIAVDGDDSSGKVEVYILDTNGARSNTCPLDRTSTCKHRDDVRTCVYNYKQQISPYPEESIVTCVKAGCTTTGIVQCNTTNKGDVERDCQLDDSDINKADTYISQINSQTERNELAECLDMDNDGDVDTDDKLCLANVVSGNWYGDKNGGSDNIGTCTKPMRGGFCFAIDTDSALPGDMVDDGNINGDDEAIMVKIIDAVSHGVTPHQDILDIADFNQDGTVSKIDLTCLQGFMTVDFSTGQVLQSTIPIATECMAIFDLQCRGTEGDLTGDGKVTETDFAILNLMVNGQLEVISGIEDCADINDDGIVDEEDVECMQALFSGEREEWLICLDCQQNLPAEAYGDEICGDGYDNNCDNLKDKEDPICNCDENTPCDTKYDTDGGSSPGVSDGNYKKCRKLSWESEATGEGGWNWYTEDEIKCSKEGDSSCGAMQCEDKIYKCSSGTGGATGKWYEIPEYCCWRGDNGGVGTYSKFAWIEWTHDFVAAQASDHMWSACLTTEKLAAQGLTCESFKARVAAGESLSSLGFTNNGYKGSGDIVFLPQGPCNWQYQGASSNYYLPYEDSWRNKGDGWDNNCYTGDCSS